MTDYPPTNPYQGSTFTMRPHRGTAVLVLGILGVLLGQIVGIVAWVMGNGDLRDMDEGRMDPSGRSMTNAGRILGMVSVGLIVLGVLVFVAAMALGLFAATQTGTLAPSVAP